MHLEANKWFCRKTIGFWACTLFGNTQGGWSWWKADRKHDHPKCMYALGLVRTRSSMYTLHNYCSHKYIAQITGTHLWGSPHLILQRMGGKDSIPHWWWLTCLPLMSSSSVIKQYNGHVYMNKWIRIYIPYSSKCVHMHARMHACTHTHVYTPKKDVYEHKHIPCPTNSFQSV